MRVIECVENNSLNENYRTWRIRVISNNGIAYEANVRHFICYPDIFHVSFACGEPYLMRKFIYDYMINLTLTEAIERELL